MPSLCLDDCIEPVIHLILSVSRTLPEDVHTALQKAHVAETTPAATQVLTDLLENAAYAPAHNLPLCQDTGVAIFFVSLGQDLCLKKGPRASTLHQALTLATSTAYTQGFLRASVCHPFSRVNTGDNTPVFLHLDIVPGADLSITFFPKGGGAENMSALAMFPPSAGRQGIINFVVETVSKAGPNPCPPLILGIGVGGTFDTVPTLAKKALLRPIGAPPAGPFAADLAALETELTPLIRELPIGAGGFGGLHTALAVHVEMQYCHIASLPCAVNIQCNSARRGTIIWEEGKGFVREGEKK